MPRAPLLFPRDVYKDIADGYLHTAWAYTQTELGEVTLDLYDDGVIIELSGQSERYNLDGQQTPEKVNSAVRSAIKSFVRAHKARAKAAERAVRAWFAEYVERIGANANAFTVRVYMDGVNPDSLEARHPNGGKIIIDSFTVRFDDDDDTRAVVLQSSIPEIK